MEGMNEAAEQVPAWGGDQGDGGGGRRGDGHFGNRTVAELLNAKNSGFRYVMVPGYGRPRGARLRQLLQ